MLKSIVVGAALTLCAVTAPSAAAQVTALAAAEAPIDPARLDAANAVVDHIFPTGTYARMMNGSFQAMMKSAMNGAGELPLRQLAEIAGASQDEVSKLADGTLNQMMEIYDPAYKQRMGAMMDAMNGELGKLMTTFEPAMREGLAQAYAKHFSVEQMGDLNRFFDTPTGKAYAADSMLLFMDPAVMERMQKAMPEILKQMPTMIKAMEAATANLPKPKQYKDLTPAERTKLAKLLGITDAQLARQHRK